MRGRVQALEKFNIEKDIAAFIKKEFDKKYNPTWHCIVGRYACPLPLSLTRSLTRSLTHSLTRSRTHARTHALAHSRRNFGSYVTHETKHFIYFYLGQIAVLLFKSG